MRGTRTALTLLFIASLATPTSFGPVSASADALDPAAGQYQTLPLTRIVDSRSGLGTPGNVVGKLGANATWNITVQGVGGVPSSGAQAVAVEITTLNTVSGGYLTAYPTGTALPSASTLNEANGQTVGNLAIVPISDSGQISLYNHVGSTDLLVDVQGYVTSQSDSSAAGTYTPLTTARLFDTRTGVGGVSGPIAAGGTITESVGGVGGVPSTGVSAVAINVGTVDATSQSYVTVWPHGQTQPTASSMDTVVGDAVMRLLIVPMSSDGKISIFNHLGSVDTFGDIVGYFNSSTTSNVGDAYVPLAATRIIDTRSASRIGSLSTLTSGSTNTVPVLGSGGIPTTGVGAVAVNLTTLNATISGGSSVVAYADGTTRPSPATTIIASSGLIQNNTALVPVGSNGKIAIYNASGSTDLLVDVVGYLQKPTAPTQPTMITAAQQGNLAYIDWLPPLSDGGAAITGYQITADQGGPTLTVPSSSTTATVTGLSASVSYHFTVAAVNAVSVGPIQDADTVPAAPPDAVDALEASSTAGAGAVSASWDTPPSMLSASPNSSTGFVAKLYQAGILASTQTLAVGQQEVTFGNLSPGVAYTVGVAALNRFGTGPETISVAVVAGQPAPLSGINVDPGVGTLTATWDAPANAPASYTVSAVPAGGGNTVNATVSGSTTTATVAGLSNGTSYNVTVTPTDSFGSTPTPYPDLVLPQAAPAIPTGLQVSGLGSAVRVSWTGPSSLPDGYTVDLYDSSNALVDSYEAADDQTAVVFDGLSNTVQYHATLVAENEAATSPVATSGAVTAAGSQDRNAADYTVAQLSPDQADRLAPLSLTGTAESNWETMHAADVAEADDSGPLTTEGFSYIANDVNNTYDSSDPEETDSATNNTKECGQIGKYGRIPKCTRSFYVIPEVWSTRDMGDNDSNDFYWYGWHQPNASRETVIVQIGAPRCKHGVTGFDSGSGHCYRWSSKARAIEHLMYGWIQNPRHQPHSVLHVVVATSSSGPVRGQKLETNGETASNVLAAELQPYANELSREFFGQNAKDIVVHAGSDDEASTGRNPDGNYTWDKPTGILLWHDGVSARYPVNNISQWNNIFFLGSCKGPEPTCWTNIHDDARSWSLYDEWYVLAGALNPPPHTPPGPSHKAGFPQEYSWGRGRGYVAIDQAASVNQEPRPKYVGVEYGCGPVGSISKPGDAWNDFVHYESLKPAFLTNHVALIHSHDHTCA